MKAEERRKWRMCSRGLCRVLSVRWRDKMILRASRFIVLSVIAPESPYWIPPLRSLSHAKEGAYGICCPGIGPKHILFGG